MTPQEIFGDGKCDKIILDDDGYQYYVFDQSDEIANIQTLISSYTYTGHERINRPKNYQLYGVPTRLLRLYFGSTHEYEMIITEYDQGYVVINNRLCRVKEGIKELENKLYAMTKDKTAIRW